MSLDEKRALLKEGLDFYRDNAESVRFPPNIPVSIILPANWNKEFKKEQRVKTETDGTEKKYAVTIFRVRNPNAADPHKLRTLTASHALFAEMKVVIEEISEKGWNGEIIMRIEKKVRGGNPFGKWSVQGREFEEEVTDNNKK